jgi:3-dehydroquinate synthase
VAHALETATGHAEWRHGEAVAVGLVVAARLSLRRGLLAEQEQVELERALTAYALPTSLPVDVDAAEIVRLTRFDKKREAGRRRMVLPLRGAGAALYHVDDDELLAALV